MSKEKEYIPLRVPKLVCACGVDAECLGFWHKTNPYSLGYRCDNCATEYSVDIESNTVPIENLYCLGVLSPTGKEDYV